MSKDQQGPEAPPEYADVWHQLDPGTQLLLSDPEGLIPSEEPQYRPNQPENGDIAEMMAYNYGFEAAHRLIEKDSLQKENQQTVQERDHAQQAAKEARYEATHDKLTGFYNKAGFDAAFRRMTETNPDADIGILYFDVNNFKAVNDEHGHKQGDNLLMDIAQWLRDVNRHPAQPMEKQIDPSEQDMIMARVGGDEIIVAVNYSRNSRHSKENEKISVEKELVAHRDRLMEDFNKFMEDEHFLLQQFNVGIAIGVAHWRPGMDIDEVKVVADRDMYRQKAISKAGKSKRR